MPFTSAKQMRFMFKNKPKIAKKWAKKYGTNINDTIYKAKVGKKS